MTPFLVLPAVRCIHEAGAWKAPELSALPSVDDDEVALAQGLVQARSPGGQDLDGLVHVAPHCPSGHLEPGSHLGGSLVLPQVGEDEQSLVLAARFPPR